MAEEIHKTEGGFEIRNLEFRTLFAVVLELTDQDGLNPSSIAVRDVASGQYAIFHTRELAETEAERLNKSFGKHRVCCVACNFYHAVGSGPLASGERPTLVEKSPVKSVKVVANADDATFPSSPSELVFCGLLCDLVSAMPGLRYDAYIDALIIANQPQKYKRLLITEDREKFIGLTHDLYQQHNSKSDQRVPWLELQRLLTSNGLIVKTWKNLLEVGSRFEEMRPNYPSINQELISLICKASTTLRESQEEASNG